MHTDRARERTDQSTPRTEPAQPDAPQRRAEDADTDTRDFGRRMNELDAAGTVEQHGEPSDASASGGHKRADDETDTPKQGDDAHSIRNLVRGPAGVIGLAATSIAMLLGARAGNTKATGAIALASEPLTPPEKRAEEAGVKWDLTPSDHERVDFFVEFLMGRNHDNTRAWLERIGKYGPMIRNELRERGMPEDLLYLTMIESGLNPNAYSTAHAAGLWQFIEETGERYGLEVTRFVDERRDPIKSTAAALTYLQQMHDRFGSWYLSAAGYNTGENRVGRLMREETGSETGTDQGYWDIWSRLPSETRDYVPLMIAMAKIAKEPGKYGFHDLEYQQPLKFDEVIVPGGTTLSSIAKAAGVDTDLIADLNPHLVKKQTPPGRRVAVRVPVGQQQQVAAALDGEAINTPVVAD
jgi:hypothetical protein